MFRPLPAIGGGNLPNYIDVTAAEDLTRGRFCALDDAGRAVLAQEGGKRAAGVTLAEAAAGETVRLQVYGILKNFVYSFPARVGHIYYQAPDGYISSSVNSDIPLNYPLAQSLDESTLLLLLDAQWLTGGGGDSGLAYFRAVAAEDTEMGMLCSVTDDGELKPASKTGRKAVGMACHACVAGDWLRVQVTGVFDNYPFTDGLTLGEIYFQGDEGKPMPLDAPVTVKYPALIPVAEGKARILPDAGYGTGGGQAQINVTAAIKSFTVTGDGLKSEWPLDHELNSEWPVVQMYSVSASDATTMDWEVLTVNSIILRSALPLEDQETITVTVIGTSPIQPTDGIAKLLTFSLQGDGEKRLWYINHGLKNNWPVIQIYEQAARIPVEMDWETAGEDTIRVMSALPLEDGSNYVITIVA